MPLNSKQQKYLLNLLRKTLEHFFDTKKKYQPEEQNEIDEELKEKCACFVTLKQKNALRGCIGTILPAEPLYQAVISNTLEAAFADPRFSPLQKEELEITDIEISVLTVPQKLAYKSTDELLKFLQAKNPGVILKFQDSASQSVGVNSWCGYFQATFLPQVWEELPRPEEFLSHLSLKAGLDFNAWQTKNPEILIYEAQVFSDNKGY